jgi:leader peptidase (prepilin peptidase)/N-methyltransferase
VELSPIVLIAGAVLVAVVLGPWLTRVAARLAARDDTAGAAPVRTAVVTLLLVLLLAGAAALVGARPALVGIGWVAAAAVVLGAVDLASHRLPDRVTCPAAVVCAAALTADAAALGSWDALVRALLAAGASGGVAALAWLVVPAGLGLGDVKLLALLGLVLGWVGWGVLLAGIFLGLVVGSLVSVVLLLTRRAGWRTALPFGPPLLTGAVLALAVQGPASLG